METVIELASWCHCPDDKVLIYVKRTEEGPVHGEHLCELTVIVVVTMAVRENSAGQNPPEILDELDSASFCEVVCSLPPVHPGHCSVERWLSPHGHL